VFINLSVDVESAGVKSIVGGETILDMAYDEAPKLIQWPGRRICTRSGPMRASL